MNNNVDSKEELAVKNDTMLLDKNKYDLDNSMDSLNTFFVNYSTNTLANDINNRICIIKNIDPTSEQGKTMLNTVIGFFTILSNKFKELIIAKTQKLKDNLNTITSEDYNKELRYLSIYTNNQLLAFYEENINMLLDELANDVDNLTREKINNYLFEAIHEKMMNMLRDKFDFSIKLISNNYNANEEIMKNINEKTLNKV